MKIAIDKIKIGERRREDLGDDFEDLKTSIKLRGQMNPILISKEDYQLIAGFRRYSCCKELGMKEVEVRFYENLSEIDKKILELEENIHKTLTWKERAMLVQDIHRLKQEQHGAAKQGHAGKGWGIAQTAELLGMPVSTVSEDLNLAASIEAVPELTALKSRRQALKTTDKLSEMAILAELAKREEAEKKLESNLYVLLHGDAVKLIKEKIEDEVVDLIIFDPPWGIDVDKIASARGPRSEKTSYRDDTIFTSRKLVEDLLPELHRILKPDGHMYIFYDFSQRDYYINILNNYLYYTSPETMISMLSPQLQKAIADEIAQKQAERSWSFHVEEKPLIWIKEGGGFTDFEHKFMPRYESFLFCSKGIKKPLSSACSDVFVYNRPVTTERIHTQEKPRELIERLIQLSTNQGDLVVDPCAGSFVTAAAATKLKRKSISIELDKDCYLRGVERMKGFSSKEDK